MDESFTIRLEFNIPFIILFKVFVYLHLAVEHVVLDLVLVVGHQCYNFRRKITLILRYKCITFVAAFQIWFKSIDLLFYFCLWMALCISIDFNLFPQVFSKPLCDYNFFVITFKLIYHVTLSIKVVNGFSYLFFLLDCLILKLVMFHLHFHLLSHYRLKCRSNHLLDLSL